MPEYIDIHGSQYQYVMITCILLQQYYHTCSVCHCLPVCYQAMLLGMSL